MTVERFFKNGKLTNIPRKNKDKLLVFDKLIENFSEEDYTEKEINTILKDYYDDYAIIRRYLGDNNYLNRDSYGNSYKKVNKEMVKGEKL